MQHRLGTWNSARAWVTNVSKLTHPLMKAKLGRHFGAQNRIPFRRYFRIIFCSNGHSHFRRTALPQRTDLVFLFVIRALLTLGNVFIPIKPITSLEELRKCEITLGTRETLCSADFQNRTAFLTRLTSWIFFQSLVDDRTVLFRNHIAQLKTVMSYDDTTVGILRLGAYVQVIIMILNTITFLTRFAKHEQYQMQKATYAQFSHALRKCFPLVYIYIHNKTTLSINS